MQRGGTASCGSSQSSLLSSRLRSTSFGSSRSYAPSARHAQVYPRIGVVAIEGDTKGNGTGGQGGQGAHNG